MTEFTPDKIAEDVLRLDAADGGQWVMGEVLDGAANIYGLADGDDDSPHVADRVPVALAELIVAYRNDAPILAREVNHLRQELCRTELLRQQAVEDLWKAQQQGEVPYRPGLPSVEQVRAHEARGGWWMGRIEKRPQRWPDALRFVNMIATGKIIQYAEGNDGHFFAGPTLTNPLGDWDDEAFLARYAWRPCLPDGTPCPWGDL